VVRRPAEANRSGRVKEADRRALQGVRRGRTVAGTGRSERLHLTRRHRTELAVLLALVVLALLVLAPVADAGLAFAIGAGS
jgi:hypothetical protein